MMVAETRTAAVLSAYLMLAAHASGAIEPRLAAPLCSAELVRGARVYPAVAGAGLASGDLLRTGSLGVAIVRLNDGDATLELRSRTQVVVSWDGDMLALQLDQGRIRVSVSHEPIHVAHAGSACTLADADVELAAEPRDEWFAVGVVRGRAVVSVGGSHVGHDLSAGDQLRVYSDRWSERAAHRLGEVAGLTQGQKARLLIAELGLEPELGTSAPSEAESIAFLSARGLVPCGLDRPLILANALWRHHLLPEEVSYFPGLDRHEALTLLRAIGCVPPEGRWEAERPLTPADLECILGSPLPAPRRVSVAGARRLRGQQTTESELSGRPRRQVVSRSGRPRGNLVRCKPLSTTVAVGEVFDLDVVITTIQPVAHTPFWVSYDKAVVQIVAVKEGDFLRRGGEVSFLYAPMSNALVVGLSLRGPSAGVVGSGTLVTLRLRALTPGSSFQEFINAALRDPSNRRLPASFRGCQVSVE